MSNMFKDCTKLKEIEVPIYNTEKVQNISRMFKGCLEII